MGIFGGPTNEAMGLGLRVPSTAARPDPATRMGLGEIQNTQADTAIAGRSVRDTALKRLEGVTAAMPPAAPVAPARPPATVYFNQSTNEMFAGDRAFKADDTQSALQAAAKPANTTRPQGEGWTSLPEGSFDQYLSSFSERRSKGELLGRGVKQIAYGLTALPGSLLTLAGAESIGEPMRQAAQDVFGESENEQLRSYLISQRSSFGEKVTDTVIEAVPMLFSAVFGGWAASALGAASKTGAVASAARTLGPRGGAAITTMPIHMTSFFEAAERNGMDVTDPQVRAEIVGGTLFNTVLDMYGAGGAAGRLGSLLSPAARNALQQASSTTSRNLLRRAGVEGIRTGAAEAVTETMQTFMEMALFDPVVRENMSPADWKFLAPHMSENYIENLKLAGVSGAVLGFGAGATIGAFNGPKPPIPTNQPTDLNTTATEQSAEKEVDPNLYGQQSFQPLGLPYIPGAPTIGTIPLSGEAMDLPKTATGPLTTPLTPGQIALQRAGTGGLQPEDRQSGNITLPYGDRRDPITGDVIDAVPAGRARLLGLPAPPTIAALPAPSIAPVADYYDTPAGLVPGDAPAASAPATTAPLGTRGATLLAPGAPTARLSAPPSGTMADPLRTALAQREAAAAQQATADQQAADQQAENERTTAEATRQAQLAAGAQQAQVEDAYTQREAQLRSQADNQVRVAEEQVTTARSAWDGFRNKKNLTLMPKAKRTVAQSVEFDTLAPAAQQRWLDAVRAGKATEKLYKTLRNAAASTPASEAQSPAVVEAETVLTEKAQQWDRANRSQISDEWFANGSAIANPAFNAVETRGAASIPAHGMAKIPTLSKATENLLAMLRGGIRPGLYTDSLANPARGTGGATGTAGGAAYRDGPFIITFRRGLSGSPTSADVTGVLVNSAHPEIIPELRALFPDLAIESYLDVGKLPDLDTTPPTKPGGKKAPGEARIKETAAKPAAPKKAALKAGTTKKPAAAPKAAKSEATPAAAPVVEVEPEVQAPAKKPAPERVAALQARVDGLNDEQLRTLQATVESSTGQVEVDLDKAIESDTKVVEDALDLVLGEKRGPMVVRKEVVEVTAARVGAADPVIDLGNLIQLVNSGEQKPGWTAEFKRLVAAVRSSKTPDAVLAVGAKQVRLVDFVKPDGNPNTVTDKKGRKTIVPVESDGKPFLSTWNTIDGVVDLDGKPVTPLATGRVQMLVRNLTAKFARPPKITVARNQADLKTKNPELYKQAVAARPQGDFDTIPAMGYSFGDGQVIIFTDRIGTEQQLQFVLAHEALGHYGLRSVMPAGKFNAAMDQVYNSDPRVAAVVDQAVEVRGLSRAEATEEYLADYAAVLDMSLLRRLAGAMKTALNAVGFRFSDDMVRHLLRMSRRYVRNGKQDSLFTVESIFSDISTIESGVDQLGTGRFKSGFASDNIRVDRLVYNVHGLPRTVEDVTAALKPAKEKVSLAAEKILRKAFSLTGFNALDNSGSALVNEILSKGGEVTADLRNRGDAILRFALDREFRVAGIKVMGGITETEQLAASRLNYGQQDDIRGKVEARIASVTKALKAAGKPTRMFTIVGDTVKPNEDTIAAYAKAGTLDIPEAKAILAKDDRYKKIADELNKDHPTWKAYLAVREVQKMVDVEFVQANYEALVADRKNGIETVESMLTSNKDKITDKEEAMLRQAMDKHYELYSAGSVVVEGNVVATDGSAKAAAEFLKTLNEAFIAKGFDTTKEDALRVYFKDKMADDFIAQLVGLRKRVTRTAENEYLLQKTIQDISASERSYSSAETSVRQMLAQGYTPIVRKDEQFQMRLVAYDPVTEEFVQLSEDARGQAAYRVFGTLQEATTLATLANAPFLDTTTPVDADVTDVEIITLKDGTTKRVYKIEGRSDGKSEFTPRSVELRFEVSEAASGVHASLEMNVHEFLRGAQRFGLNIKPSQLEKIIVAMTAQDARARKRLQQTGNPGYEVQGGVTAIEAIAGHVDTRSSLIAKIKMRPALDKVMNLKLPNSRKLWFGDTEKLDRLKKTYDASLVDPNANEDTRFVAKQEYTDYAYKMGKTITTVNGVSANLGNKFYSENQSLMAFINGNRDVNETDWGAGAIPSWVRRWAGASQLGGTLTQPIMNNIGPFTNFIPWLGTFNEKNAFGGGAGITNAYTQYLQAVTDVGGSGGLSFSERALKMHTGDYWNQVATGLETHPGVTKPEAEFIGKETLSGILTPAQANSLLGASRNFTTNPAVRRALDKWMFFYVSSEQATRRSAALAAFRVEWQRQTSAIGKAPNDKLSDAEYKRIHARASDFATQGVLLTLGDYGAKARPAVWRSGFQSFLYMYKVWPTTTIQTLSRLSWPGKAMMLAPLLLASGVAGLPFAEDGEDFIDTVLQRTGRTSGSVRIELARLIDEIWPGASPYILKGGLSSMLGTDVAGRFGAGDFLPGTAGFLPGQELSATVREVLGPAWGFVEGTFTGGSQLAAAPFTDTATVVDAMRGGPITIFRALGDAIAYNSAGAVIDKRGYVIDPDLTTGMLIGRVLGFTPASVASQYEVIRLAKRETNYQKQVVTKFRTALLKAELSGDRVRAASIRRTVKDWNEATDGTLLEIKNFEKNYQRLFKLANMSAKNRFIQSVGKNNREAIELTNELIGFD